MPAFSDIQSDGEDRVWVQSYRHDWDRSTPREWLVFSEDGLVARVETPPGMEIMDIGSDHVLTHTQDDLGVEVLSVYELVR